MTLDSSNVRVAVTGVVSIGTVSAAAPTGAETVLGTGWTDLGYAGEDGVTETRNRTTNTIRAWQNGDTVREVITEADLSIQTVLLETKKETIELYYGGTVDTNGGIAIVPASTGGRKKFNVDVIDGDEFVRLYIPSGEVIEVGDQVYSNGEPIGYEVTIKAYPDATITDGDGNVGVARKWYSALDTTP